MPDQARGVRALRRGVRVVEADYTAVFDELRRIRFAVFVREQGVPAALEMDERDAVCIHVLAYIDEADEGDEADGVDEGDEAAPGRDPRADGRAPDSRRTPRGTGRIDIDAGGKIGRVAVESGVRRSGVGSAIMQALHGIAASRGLRRVWCHAQLSAAPFYARLGYRAVGAEFEEAGIPHIKMERVID
jgi:predicted GNAT family N-acyltransferase